MAIGKKSSMAIIKALCTTLMLQMGIRALEHSFAIAKNYLKVFKLPLSCAKQASSDYIQACETGTSLKCEPL